MLYKALKVYGHKIIMLGVGDNKLPNFLLCCAQLKAIFVVIKKDFGIF